MGLGNQDSYDDLNNPSKLYVIAVTSSTDSNMIDYVNHVRIDVSEHKLRDELEIIANYDTNTNHDIITVSSADSDGYLPEFQAWTVSFEVATNQWTNPGYISSAHGNILNYPVQPVKEEDTQIVSLHTVFEDHNQIFIVTSSVPKTEDGAQNIKTSY
jgi:hypothetical protein